MFPRVKVVGERRYVYLVEGVREGGKVKQRTLCYLGSVSKLASGITEATKRKAGRKLDVDWRGVDEAIRRIPLTFEELSEARRESFAAVIKGRDGRMSGGSGGRPREEGELSALARIAAARFADYFEEVGELSYRMK